jgi:uncharacterized small protein (TIGR04563 family)
MLGTALGKVSPNRKKGTTMSERFGRAAREDGNMGEGRAKADMRKQSLYLGDEVLQQAKEEAARLDRSLSWVFQKAWHIAHTKIQAMPSMGDASHSGGSQEAEPPEGND